MVKICIITSWVYYVIQSDVTRKMLCIEGVCDAFEFSAGPLDGVVEQV